MNDLAIMWEGQCRWQEEIEYLETQWGVCIALFCMVSSLLPVHMMNNSWVEQVSTLSDYTDPYLLYLPSLQHQIPSNWALTTQTFISLVILAFLLKNMKIPTSHRASWCYLLHKLRLRFPEAYMQWHAAEHRWECAWLPEQLWGALRMLCNWVQRVR